MKRQVRCSIASIVLLILLPFQQQVVLAQDSSPGKTRDATEEVLIWRVGDPYEVPPLKIRLLYGPGAPVMLTSVQVTFRTRWLASSNPDYHGPGGWAEISTDVVTDVDGYFSTSKTKVVPSGMAPVGDNPLFVPRFVDILVCYKDTEGTHCHIIQPETIEAVRSGRLACIDLRWSPKTAEPRDALTESDVAVRADVYWVSSRVRVQRGDFVRVTATGTINLGRQGTCGPDGIGTIDPTALLPDKPVGALIAVIGDDNDDFIFIGAAAEFVSAHDGYVAFGVNEGDLEDNSGAFAAHIRVRR